MLLSHHGILIYAPSCISMELYHADTGMLLCSHYPVYGESHQVE